MAAMKQKLKEAEEQVRVLLFVNKLIFPFGFWDFLTFLESVSGPVEFWEKAFESSKLGKFDAV